MQLRKSMLLDEGGSPAWVEWRRKRVGHLLSNGLLFVIIVGCGILFLAPFAWMISASLKTLPEIQKIPQPLLPKVPQWSNYWIAWTSLPFTRWLINTSIITLTSIIGTLLSCSLAAYGFAFSRFPGRNILFVVLLASMMLPYHVRLIPTFLIFQYLGWINTFLPLTVPTFFGVAFYIFLLRQFFLTLPKELNDAALIDGCNSFGIYCRIILPLSGPALAAVTALTFIDNWNDFLGPLVYLRQDSMLTLSVGLRMFLNFQEGTGDLQLMMAASVATLLPILVVFFLAQKHFVEGVTFTGLKG
jgi:multiple sugar transport system permease protein